MDIIEIIEHKRDKEILSKEEIEYFVTNYTNNLIPDYQASALIMAMYLNGLNEDETYNLTMAMVNSGEIVDLSCISDIIVDKHSTGGVGDKITIILMPIIASLGIPVAKVSGRGLGYTGGTADKLESIPNYRVDISIEEFKQNIKDIGISLITSNANLVPADKKIYALRDTIGCVPNIPLIASSIMSKKIASGANKIAMELTCGNGAFMKDLENASKLAKTMIEIGKSAKIDVRCVITSMDEPVGHAIGNQLEIIEAIEALKGNMTDDVEEIVYSIGTQLINMAGKADNEEIARSLIQDAIESGKAYNKFKELVLKQGGDISYIENSEKFEKAKCIVPVIAETKGFISSINTEEIGRISCYIGAGRENKEDKIDYEAGIIITKKIGDSIDIGEPLAYLHTNEQDRVDESVKRLLKAFSITNIQNKSRKTIIDVIK